MMPALSGFGSSANDREVSSRARDRTASEERRMVGSPQGKVSRVAASIRGEPGPRKDPAEEFGLLRFFDGVGYRKLLAPEAARDAGDVVASVVGRPTQSGPRPRRPLAVGPA